MPTDKDFVVKIPPMRDTDNITPPKINIPPIPPDTPNTTVIHGHANPKTCRRQAAYLCKLVYKDPPPTGGFSTLYPDKIAEAEKNWEEWGDGLNDQANTGLVAKLYKVKGYDPNSKTDVCPPTLVFRGTDFDDMRDFAFCVILKITPGAGETPVIDLQDVLEKQYPGGEIMFTMDKRLKGKSRKELIADNFIPVTLLNSSGAFRLLGVPYQASLQLIFLGGPNGDWANNVEQGLGKPSEQYKKATIYARTTVADKIKSGQDRRLNIAGHSLGGGLASAAATIVEHYYHTEITTLCHTFNPSGVNTETVKPASLGEATINAFGVRDEILTTIETRAGQLPFLGAILRWAKAEANIDGFPAPAGNFVPRKGISPGPSGDPPQTRPVVLPTGGIGQQIIPTWQPPARGAELPVVWPITAQTVFPAATANNFRLTLALDGILNSSTSFVQALNLLSARIPGWVEDAVNANSKIRVPPPGPNTSYQPWVYDKFTFGDLLGKMAQDRTRTVAKAYRGFLDAQVVLPVVAPALVTFALEFSCLQTLFEVSSAYHGMDYVIATFEQYLDTE